MKGLRILTRSGLVVGLCLAIAPPSRADRIFLRGGGELRGLIVTDPDRPDKVLVQTEKGTNPTVFEKGQVSKVVRAPGPLDQYIPRRERLESTAEAQYELGLWCEQAGLSGLADLHFRKAVGLDKQFGPAHKKLGHSLHAGRWLSTDEIREAQGLIKHKGRWITAEEKARLDASAAFSAEQVAWVKRLRVMRQAMYSDKAETRDRSEADLLAIRDPAAAAPLAQVFARDPEPTRVLVARTIGGIPGPEAAEALVGRVLTDADFEPRQAALAELVSREDSPESTARLLKALKHPDQTIVGRAAWGLAGLGVTSAVPKLIPALVQVRSRVVMVPSAGGGGGGGTAFFGGGQSYPVLIPAVGQGVTAIGAVGVPVFSGASVSYGGGGGPPPPQPRLVQDVLPNEAVREALVRLTGADFGFDIPTWRRWLVTSFRPEPAATRRVPQP